MPCDDESTRSVLRSVFGYEDFVSPVQREAVNAVREGTNDVCICMPPGSGKSLCFQLPAVMEKGKVAIVFTPKLSFAKVEVEYLRSKRINARLLSPKSPARESRDIKADLLSDSPNIVLLYCSPEMGINYSFQDIISKLRGQGALSYIVFKEAHSLSKLGYNYLSFYKNLKSFTNIFGSVTMIAITTAATNKVIKDICETLSMRDPKVFKIPVQRSNIYYDVCFLEMLSDPCQHLKNFIVSLIGGLNTSVKKGQADKGVAIIYCSDQTMAKEIAQKLNALGVSALLYNYKLRTRARQSLEEEFQSGKHSVIVTPYSYGFIYKMPVRCIVHWTIPESIARYYRETAEASSGAIAVHCRIYFSMKEYSSARIRIANHKQRYDDERVTTRLNDLGKSAAYCLTAKCRHEMISAYFGVASTVCGNACDVCRDVDGTEIRSRKFVAYSETVGCVKYETCDIYGDIDNEENQINVVNIPEEGSIGVRCNAAEKPEETDKSDLEIVEVVESFSEIDLGTPEWPTEDEIFTDSVPTRHSPSNGPAITQSWVNDRKTNTEVSTQPCATRRNTTEKLSEHLSFDHEKQALKKRHKIVDRCTKSRVDHSERYGVLNVRRMKRKVPSNFRKESSDKAKKRRVSNGSSEERKSETVEMLVQSESVDETLINRTGDIANENLGAKHVKDRPDVEYLMSKYKLDRDAITLIPRIVSAKR